jgi:predicted nicotinamide N-methyase
VRLPTAADTVVDEVVVGGRRYAVRRPRSAEALIDEAEFQRDERLPYWAELWPSGRMLAHILAREVLVGQRVIELGAGLALPSIAALTAGARVLATDWYPEALAAARANARAAGLGLRTMLVDWFVPPVALLGARPFDLVVAADVLYEARNAEALAALLPGLTGRRGRAIIADPRRPDAGALVDALVDAGWRHERQDLNITGRRDEAGPVIHLHRLEPPAPGQDPGVTDR